VHTNNDQENMVSRRVRTGFVRTINHQHNAKLVRRKSAAHPTGIVLSWWLLVRTKPVCALRIFAISF
jgi:hypothetical protein